MTDSAEDKVSKFYNTVGWETAGGVTEDAKRWEDLRECAQAYVSMCRLRVLRHIPAAGKSLLDMASGPIQYVEYLAYSRNFGHRYCVDLSAGALEQARKKIGEHGRFLHGSFLDLELEPDFFDCAISLHTIYHIDKGRQEEAVRKLVAVTRRGQPVVIVYSNPDTFYVKWLAGARRLLARLRRQALQEEGPGLYFHAHPIAWWQRFGDVASVEILPWRSLGANAQKALVPDNWLGKKMLAALFGLEERFPQFFVRHFQYPMIILTRHSR